MLGIFSNNRTQLRKRAEILLPAAKIAGISAYTSLLKKFPSFNSVLPKDWDFFFPVASVFIATIGMERAKINTKLKSELSEIYGKDLKEWSSKWHIAFKDCGEFFWRTVESLQSSNEPVYNQSPQYIMFDSIGSWLVWNIFAHSPESEDERQLVRVVGGLISEEFLNWWE